MESYTTEWPLGSGFFRSENAAAVVPCASQGSSPFLLHGVRGEGLPICSLQLGDTFMTSCFGDYRQTAVCVLCVQVSFVIVFSFL